MKNGKFKVNEATFYFPNSQLHREDGPAVEYTNGYKEWWTNGVQLTEEEFKQWLTKKNLNAKLHSILSPKPKIKRSKI